MFLNFACFTLQKRTTVTQISGNISTLVKLVCEYGVFWYVVYLSSAVGVKLGFHIRGKRKRLAAAACGCGKRYANDLIPYIRLPMRLHSVFLCE